MEIDQKHFENQFPCKLIRKLNNVTKEQNENLTRKLVLLAELVTFTYLMKKLVRKT